MIGSMIHWPACGTSIDQYRLKKEHFAGHIQPQGPYRCPWGRFRFSQVVTLNHGSCSCLFTIWGSVDLIQYTTYLSEEPCGTSRFVVLHTCYGRLMVEAPETSGYWAKTTTSADDKWSLWWPIRGFSNESCLLVGPFWSFPLGVGNLKYVI